MAEKKIFNGNSTEKNHHHQFANKIQGQSSNIILFKTLKWFGYFKEVFYVCVVISVNPYNSFSTFAYFFFFLIIFFRLCRTCTCAFKRTSEHRNGTLLTQLTKSPVGTIEFADKIQDNKELRNIFVRLSRL